MKTPRLSIITIAYNMPRQAQNTVYSLSTKHQKNVNEDDYEIILIENKSSNIIDANELVCHGKNIRYFLREEESQSPVPAINFALSQVRGSSVGLIIDAARMATPRVIEYGLMVSMSSIDSIVGVPSYNLGPCEHQFSEEYGYDESWEQELLQRVNWKKNGYRLFDISNVSEANKNGIYQPMLENNCYITSRNNFEKIGGANPAFMYPGGGSINIHIYKSLAMLPSCKHVFITPGEGVFHQIHGGITTKKSDHRAAVLQQHRAQLDSFWNGKFNALTREPLMLGSVTSHAQEYLRRSSMLATKRFSWIGATSRHSWEDDMRLSRTADFNR